MDVSYRVDRTGWAGFTQGAFHCTVVSDGILRMGPAAPHFPDADPGEIDRLLEEHFLPTDGIILNENLLVVDTGDQLVLFDTGLGTLHARNETSTKVFGSMTGRAVGALRHAGIDPVDIDVVALTHAHPGHCWGLVDEDGRPLFPNATVRVSKADVDHWTDLGRVRDAPDEHLADHYRGAHAALTPYLATGRVRYVSDGDVVVPGITAIATPGHSPGHVVYEIAGEDRPLICWGDLCHHEVLLLQRPDWAFRSDHDRAAATAQRRRFYELVDRNRCTVFGFHFPYPGLGHLRREGEAYSWLPVPRDLA